MTWPVPTPEEQVLFLRNIQRLLSEGRTVASYKFALLHALADLAVLKGDDTGAPLELDAKDIAVRFIELYWQQCRPFQIAGVNTGPILAQSTGKPAEIIFHITRSQRDCGTSLFRLRRDTPERWTKLVKNVGAVVCGMPLWKLQTVGKERLNFLYENLDQGRVITLKPGVAFCCRTFYELIRNLIQGGWLRYVQKLNANHLGSITDLSRFLFDQERNCLEAYRAILMDVQDGICLYCKKSLSKLSHVDHFIPWSRYPADLGHNFVLAHDRCNGAKSDHVAAEDHLASWAERNRDHQEELQTRFQEAALPFDASATVQIARWVYHQIEKANGQVWVVQKQLRHLGPSWSRCLSA